MPTALRPISELPLRMERDGSATLPEIGIFGPGDGAGSTGAPTLVVRHQRPDQSWWREMWWYAPDVALVVGLAAVLALCWRVRRVVRRPQSARRWYCRMCNHEAVPATPPISEAGRQEVPVFKGACQECGVDRTRRAPVAGRAAALRITPLAVGVLPLVVLCGVVLALRLQRYSIGSGTTWPVPWVERVAPSLALQRKALREVESVDDVGAWRLPDLKRLGGPTRLHLRGYPNSIASRDGRTLFAITSNARHGTPQALTSIDIARGSVTVPKIMAETFPRWASNTIVGMSGDGRRVFVQVDHQPAQALGAPRSNWCTCELWVVDVESWERRALVKLKTAMTPYRGSVSSPFQRFMVDESDGVVRWTHFAGRTDSQGTATHAEIRHFDGTMETALDVPISGSSGWMWPRLVDGGRALQVEAYRPRQLITTDLATQQIHAPRMPTNHTLFVSADNRYEVTNTTPQSPEVTLRDHVGRRSATLGLNRAGWFYYPAAVSADGRYVACVYGWTGGVVGAVGGAGNIGGMSVLVWEVRESDWVAEKAGAEGVE